MSTTLIIKGVGSTDVQALLPASEESIAILEQLAEDLTATASGLEAAVIDLLCGERPDRLGAAQTKIAQAAQKTYEAEVVAAEAKRMEESLTRTRRMEESVPTTTTEGSKT